MDSITASSSNSPKPANNSNSDPLANNPPKPNLDDLLKASQNQNPNPSPKPNFDDLLKASNPSSSNQNQPDDSVASDFSSLEEEDAPPIKITQRGIEELEKAKKEEISITSLNDDIDKNNPNLISSRNKEVLAGSSSPETVKFQEIKSEFEESKETGEFIKNAANEDKIKMPKVIKDDYGDIILKASNAPKPNITLPVTEEELEKAFKKRVSDSIRWLAEWCKRNILMIPKRVFFSSKDSNKPNN